MSLLFNNKLFTQNHGMAWVPPYLLPYVPPTINEEQKLFIRQNKMRTDEKWHFIWTPNDPHPANGPDPPDVSNIQLIRPKLQKV